MYRTTKWSTKIQYRNTCTPKKLGDRVCGRAGWLIPWDAHAPTSHSCLSPSCSTGQTAPCLCVLGGSREWLRCLGPCNSHGRPRERSRFLALPWPSLAVVTMWGVQQRMEDLCPSAFQVEDNKSFSMLYYFSATQIVPGNLRDPCVRWKHRAG